jgi:uncharacterized protein YndB with AHSA1/START domain
MTRKPKQQVKEIALAAAPEEIWRAVAEADGLTRWFCTHAAVDAGLGGALRVAWGAPPDGEGARITLWEPLRHLRTEDTSHGLPVAVDFELETRGGTTLLRVVQSGFADDDPTWDSTDRGWDLFLGNLRLAVERGRGLPCLHLFAMPSHALSPSAAWDRLLGPAGLGLAPGEAPDTGRAVQLAPAGEAPFAATLDLWRPGVAFGAVRADRPERLGFTVEPGEGPVYACRLVFGPPGDATAATADGWDRLVRGALAAAP